MREHPPPSVIVTLLALTGAIVFWLRVQNLKSIRFAELPPPHQLFAAGKGKKAEMFLLSRPRFILFGDSLTERCFAAGGWGASLANHYVRKVDVVSRGYGGYNTRMALPLLPHVFGDASKDNTHLVTIFFGANDAARPIGPPASAKQHIPLEEYKANLRKIVEYVRGRGIQRILLLTPPPVDDKGRRQNLIQRVGKAQATEYETDRTNDFTKPYAEACKEVARELEVPVLDLWTEVQEEQGWQERLLNDGLHFTPEGQQVLFTKVLGLINTSFPELTPETMPSHFPLWDNLDPVNPAAMFDKPVAEAAKS